MAKVTFHELSSSIDLHAVERVVNTRLADAGFTVTVRLFRSQQGDVGYSASPIPAAGGKRLLEMVHRTVCVALGYVRGRPRAPVPSHQVKCRLQEPVFKRLESAARKRGISPSRLLAELAARHVA